MSDSNKEAAFKSFELVAGLAHQIAEIVLNSGAARQEAEAALTAALAMVSVARLQPIPSLTIECGLSPDLCSQDGG